MQHLERDRPVVPKVVGQVDGGHASPAKLAHDRVTVVETLNDESWARSHGESA